MAKITRIAREQGLAVVEDAAQAVGARLDGRRVGSLGAIGCFSLHPLKNLHVHGDGGVVTTDEESLWARIKGLRNHGLASRDECVEWGFNHRLDAIQAAIAELKLAYVDEWNARHRAIARTYRDAMCELVRVPEDGPGEEAVYHNFIVQTPDREDLQAHLGAAGIETKVHYPIPIHLQPAAESLGYRRGAFPNAERQADEILSLPIYPELTDAQVELVGASVRSFFA